MLLEMRDTIGLILLSLGVDISAISSFSEAEEAFAKLEQAKADGQIRAFTGNDYWPTWSRGTSPPASAGPATSPSSRSTTRIRFIIPEEGHELGRHDADAEGRRAPRRSGAVDGLRLRPGAGGPDHRVGAVRLAGQGRAGGGRQDRSGAGRERLVFPDEEMLANVHGFANLDEETEAQFDEAFAAIVGA